MNIVWFSESVNNEDVPLCREFIAQGGKAGTITVVRTAILSGSGLLLVGDYFKGLVFNNKPVYKNLLEALELYVVKPETAMVLIIEALSNGYINAGATADFETDYHWVKDGSAYYFRATDTALVSQPVNPFVRPSSDAPTVQSRGTKKPSTPSKDKT